MGIKEIWRRVDGPVFALVLLAACCGITYVLKDHADSSERDKWQTERAGYLKRFPEVRSEERASCTKEYEAKIEGYRALAAERDKREAAQTDELAQSRQLQQNAIDLITDMRKFLDGRARVSDAALATARKGVQVSGQILETAKVAEQKATVAAAKADETASAVQSVDKKLETATRPTAAVPSHPWIGDKK